MASGDLNTLFTRNVPHILEKVFLNLDYESYKTCLEVNNEWKELLTSTSYQKTGRDVFHREILRDEMVLDYAIKKRNKEKIKIILSTGMLSLTKANSLSQVSCYGDTESAQLLIDGGAEINRMDRNGYTPLHYAALHGNKDVALLLIKHGADINKINDWNGMTPLISALTYGHTQLAHLFIDLGAETSLHHAATKGQKNYIRLLLSIGADPNLPDKDGYMGTPLIYAACSAHNTDTVKLLLDSGAKPNVANAYGCTALHSAASKGFENTIKLLINRGANVNVMNIMGQTPLISASKRGREGAVRVLIKKGADKNIADDEGNTALFYALEEGYQGVAHILTNQEQG